MRLTKSPLFAAALAASLVASCRHDTSTETASTAPAKPTLVDRSQQHWVQDQQLRTVMAELSLRTRDSWPKDVPQDPESAARPPEETFRDAAALADALAGGSVRLLRARVVGVFAPRVFLIETQTSLLPAIKRDRVLVFIESGSLRVDPAVLVASTVTVSGVARTLLGIRTNYDVPWPAALTQDTVKHLDIKAAVLAKSVRTPEGIDLVTRLSSGSAAENQPEAPRR